MKHLLTVAAITGVMTMGMASCAGGEKNTGDNDTIFTPEFADSFSMAFGQSVGGDINRMIYFGGFGDREAFNKKEFLKGLQLMMASEHSPEFYQGADVGIKLINTLQQIEAQSGMKLNRDELLRQIRNYVMADSLTEAQMIDIDSQWQQVSEKLDKTLLLRESKRNPQTPQQTVVNETDPTDVEMSEVDYTSYEEMVPGNSTKEVDQ